MSVPENLSGNAIRKAFIDYFVEKADHTFVPSASLVPGNRPSLYSVAFRCHADGVSHTCRHAAN